MAFVTYVAEFLSSQLWPSFLSCYKRLLGLQYFCIKCRPVKFVSLDHLELFKISVFGYNIREDRVRPVGCYKLQRQDKSFS